jgi:acetolactate synthase-1/2/3 large subunit
MDEAITLLKWASRPVLLVWQWIKFSWAQEELMNFINTLWIPTVPTALGKWVVKSKNENNLKMLGMHWFVHTNKAVYNADLIIGIGLRFDDRIVGTYEEFWIKAKVIHIDIDQKELGKIVSTNLSIRSDAKDFLLAFQNYNKWGKLNINNWWKQIRDWEKADPYIVKNDVFWWKQVLKKINEIMDKKDKEDIVTVDVWQHQMWATQIIDIDNPMNWLFSGWLGTMWCSLPFALGAAVSNPNKQVLSISWDGGFQMNIQELWVLNEDEWLAENPNIKIMILDNSCLWMVRQWQEKFHDNRLSWVSTRSPNFQKIGEWYNIKSHTISSFSDMDENLETILSEKWPALIWFKIKTEDNVFPMVPPGKTLWEVITE